MNKKRTTTARMSTQTGIKDPVGINLVTDSIDNKKDSGVYLCDYCDSARFIDGMHIHNLHTKICKDCFSRYPLQCDYCLGFFRLRHDGICNECKMNGFRPVKKTKRTKTE